MKNTQIRKIFTSEIWYNFQGFSFLEVKLKLLIQYPNCRKWHFYGSNFQNFLGGIPPDSHRKLAPSALESLASSTQLHLPKKSLLDPPL
jgi:hypothetical protein